MTNTFTKKSLVRFIICALMLVTLVAGSFAGCASDDAKYAAEANSAKLQELETIVKDIQSVSASIQANGATKEDIATLNALINSANAKIEALTTDISNLKSDVASIKGDVAALKNTISENNKAVTDALNSIQSVVNDILDDMISAGAYGEATTAVLGALDHMRTEYNKRVAMTDQYSPDSMVKFANLYSDYKFQLVRALTVADVTAIVGAFDSAYEAITTYLQDLQNSIADVIGADGSVVISWGKKTDIDEMIVDYNECIEKSIEIPEADQANYDAIVERYEELKAANEDAVNFINVVVVEYQKLTIVSQTQIDALRTALDAGYEKFNIPTDAEAEGYDADNYAIYANAEETFDAIVEEFGQKMISVRADYDAMLALANKIGSTINLADAADVAAAVALKDKLINQEKITEDVVLPPVSEADGEGVKVSEGYTLVATIKSSFDAHINAAVNAAAAVVGHANLGLDKTDIRNKDEFEAVQTLMNDWIKTYVTDAGLALDADAVQKIVKSGEGDDVVYFDLLSVEEKAAIDKAVADITNHDAAAKAEADRIIAAINTHATNWDNKAANADLFALFTFDTIKADIAKYLVEYYADDAILSESIHGVKDVEAKFNTYYSYYNAAIAEIKAAFAAVEAKVIAIGEIADIKLSYKSYKDGMADGKIDEARDAFDKWVADWSITTIPDWAADDKATIEAAEKKHGEVVTAYNTEVAALELATNNLPTKVTLSAKEAVTAAAGLRATLIGNAAYELSASPASNAAVLVAAEEAIATLEKLAADIKDAIDALPAYDTLVDEEGNPNADAIHAMGSDDDADGRYDYATIDAIVADIEKFVSLNDNKDGLDVEAQKALAKVQALIALVDVADERAASVNEYNAYVAGVLAAIDADASLSEDMKSELKDAINAAALKGAEELADTRMNTVDLIVATKNAALGKIDKIYTAPAAPEA